MKEESFKDVAMRQIGIPEKFDLLLICFLSIYAILFLVIVRKLVEEIRMALVMLLK
jgi:hypothetical protein